MKKHTEVLIKHKQPDARYCSHEEKKAVVFQVDKHHFTTSGNWAVMVRMCTAQGHGSAGCFPGISFMSAMAAGSSNGRHSTWSHFKGNVTAVKLCLLLQTIQPYWRPNTTPLFHCKNDVWLQSLALKRKKLDGFQFNFPPACRVHSSSSDFVICSVEIYLWVGDPRLPLDTMKGYRHF